MRERWVGSGIRRRAPVTEEDLELLRMAVGRSQQAPREHRYRWLTAVGVSGEDLGLIGAELIDAQSLGSPANRFDRFCSVR
jgi:hypothetical protein